MRTNFFTTRGTRIEFILNKMLDTHKIERTHKYRRREHLSRDSAIHNLFALALDSDGLERFRNRIERLLVVHKRCSVHLRADDGS